MWNLVSPTPKRVVLLTKVRTMNFEVIGAMFSLIGVSPI